MKYPLTFTLLDSRKKRKLRVDLLSAWSRSRWWRELNKQLCLLHHNKTLPPLDQYCIISYLQQSTPLEDNDWLHTLENVENVVLHIEDESLHHNPCLGNDNSEVYFAVLWRYYGWWQHEQNATNHYLLIHMTPSTDPSLYHTISKSLYHYRLLSLTWPDIIFIKQSALNMHDACFYLLHCTNHCYHTMPTYFKESSTISVMI